MSDQKFPMTFRTAAGETYRIMFRHDNCIDHTGKQYAMRTEAWLQPQPYEREPLFPPDNAGKSVCNPCDQFKKSTGRKLALKRALEIAGLNREDRTRAWAAYLGRAAVKDRTEPTDAAIVKAMHDMAVVCALVAQECAVTANVGAREGALLVAQEISGRFIFEKGRSGGGE